MMFKLKNLIKYNFYGVFFLVTALSLSFFSSLSSASERTEEKKEVVTSTSGHGSAPAVASTITAKPKALVVDDDKIMRKILVRLLKDKFEVEEAESKADALGKIGQTGNNFSLITTDGQMESQTAGQELITAVKGKEATRHIPIIMFSGENSTYLERAVTLGAVAAYAKPINKTNLVEGLEKAGIR